MAHSFRARLTPQPCKQAVMLYFHFVREKSNPNT